MANPNLDEPIELSSYDPTWQASAANFIAEIGNVLGDLRPTIEHIGSTAIAGMHAKPVIDLMLDIERMDDVEEAVKRLNRFGWEDFGEAGVPGRRYLRKRRGLAANVHIIRKASELWIENLSLRDFLRSHPEQAEAYSALKTSLMRQGHQTLLAYSTAKAAYVQQMLQKARRWTGPKR